MLCDLDVDLKAIDYHDERDTPSNYRDGRAEEYHPHQPSVGYTREHTKEQTYQSESEHHSHGADISDDGNHNGNRNSGSGDNGRVVYQLFQLYHKKHSKTAKLLLH